MIRLQLRNVDAPGIRDHGHPPPSLAALGTVAQIREAFERALGDVEQSGAPAVARAGAVARLVGVALNVLEVGELGEQVAEPRNLVAERVPGPLTGLGWRRERSRDLGPAPGCSTGPAPTTGDADLDAQLRYLSDHDLERLADPMDQICELYPRLLRPVLRPTGWSTSKFIENSPPPARDRLHQAAVPPTEAPQAMANDGFVGLDSRRWVVGLPDGSVVFLPELDPTDGPAPDGFAGFLALGFDDGRPSK
jgi:hypothetical protein